MANALRAVCAAAVVLLGIAPVPAQAEERGAEIYADLCASCHGRYGRGDGPLASSLASPPPDFTDSAWRAGRSRDQIVEGLTSASHSPMAIAQVLKPTALAAAVDYILALSVPGGHLSVAEGRDIYNASCWICHGRKGDGHGPAAKNLSGPSPRNFTSPEFKIAGREDEIVRTISKGAAVSFHGSPMMTEWGSGLSQRQIRSLVEYLKTLKKR